MLNKYTWDIYLNAGGNKVVDFFEKSLTGNYTTEYADFVCELHRDYCPSKAINEALHEQLSYLLESIENGTWFLEDGEYTIESALEYIYTKNLSEDGDTPRNVFEYFSDCIDSFTTLFAIEAPGLFVPYYFKYNFNVFEAIAKEFGIDLPPLPAKKDYKDRFFYYGKICTVLQIFREEQNMTLFELCAFLYDFAPKYVGGVDSYIVTDLPSPKSAYFIGGCKDDAFLSDDPEIIALWQCNPDTRVGDAIVMYLKTPISAVDSVWRSVSIGFNDPFFYYYRCTYIAKPIKIKQISQEGLKRDSVFKELPIVKKNMQGINGVELYPSVYNHLLDMAKSDLPRFDFNIDSNKQGLKREKDVEDKIVKPFLKRLGYAEDEYVQQLQIRVGNHNFKLIPDFTINPVVANGHHSAKYHIEVKYSIQSSKILEEVKIQARSYAKQLGTEYSVIVDKERIWISAKSDDYEKDLLSFSWDELDSNDDNYYKVFKLLGKDM